MTRLARQHGSVPARLRGSVQAQLLHDERGSTIPLMLGFFILAGAMLIGGIVAAAAFVQLRSLQSGCDGAAVAATNGFSRGSGTLDAGLPFDEDAARAAVAAYAASAWGQEAAAVEIDLAVDQGRISLRCTRVAHVPFEAVFAPEGITQTVFATSRSPLVG